MGLEGRTALVTGAAGGIGLATVEVLAAAGARIAAVDVSERVEEAARVAGTAGVEAASAVIDIADPQAVAKGVAALAERLGTIDILVNNAGIVANIAPLSRMTPAAWSREIEVNLSGAFHMVQAVIGPMAEQRHGRIVNVSSVAARGGLHNQVGYAASKTGLLGLTHTVALEHGRDGVTCNAVLPGLIETANVQAMPAEIRDTFAAVAPARRLGRVEEVAQVIAFLASDEAAYVNGAEIDVDGGLRLNTISMASRKELRQVFGKD